MLAAHTEQTSLKKKPYKTTNKATGDASPKKVDIPSEVERSMLPNMRTKPIKRPIQPKVRAELPKKFTVSWLNLPLLIARAEKKAPPASIDNDGISNFYESLGDGKISFQDPLNPEITLLSGTVIPGVISGSVVSTRDDHAISNGTVESSFESQVEAGVDQSLIYTLDFSEKLNILVSDSNIDVAQIDGESFVLKSLPSTTNITLLDPDDNLLVDTDFDGIFEDNEHAHYHLHL